MSGRVVRRREPSSCCGCPGVPLAAIAPVAATLLTLLDGRPVAWKGPRRTPTPPPAWCETADPASPEAAEILASRAYAEGDMARPGGSVTGRLYDAVRREADRPNVLLGGEGDAVAPLRPPTTQRYDAKSIEE